MAGYTKEFLVEAFTSRYEPIKVSMGAERWKSFVGMTNTHYDKVGKDEFRKSASLDAEAIRKFKLAR